MFETDSLCYIGRDYGGKLWLYRLADVIDGKLHEPYKSEQHTQDRTFENRDRLILRGEPNKYGIVGIWHWSAKPRSSNPEKDDIDTNYIAAYSPIRVVVIPANSIEDMIERISNGSVHIDVPSSCDIFFCYADPLGQLVGIVCNKSKQKVIDDTGCISIVDGLYFLPRYTFRWDDVISCHINNNNVYFLKTLCLPASTKPVLINNADSVIRELFLKRLTWPFYKESIGGTRANWKSCQTILERICNKSLYQEVSETLRCTPEYAKQAVDNFVRRANATIESGDIDADVLARIALNHDELRERCEETVSKRWEEEHKKEIDEALKEIAAKQEEITEADNALSSAKEKHADLLAKIETSQKQLAMLAADIERNEMLAHDTVELVHKRISEAQEDMAGFIADISVFLPRINVPKSAEDLPTGWYYTSPSAAEFSEDDLDIAESWEDEFATIAHNLSRFFADDAAGLRKMLAAFLYAAYVNNMPLLLVGPGGEELANALSVSLFGCGAGNLYIGDGSSYSMIDKIEDSAEQVVSIQNMFGKGWVDTLPQDLCKIEKQIIWMHPYAEDMNIEPQGIYNYMLPVLNECIIEAVPNGSFSPGKRAVDFDAYIPDESEYTLCLRSAFKQLGLSKLLINRLETVLSDAKTILGNKEKDKAMELLFGLLPLCVLTGRTDLLREVVEREENISEDVKTEIERYIGEA